MSGRQRYGQVHVAMGHIGDEGEDRGIQFRIGAALDEFDQNADVAGERGRKPPRNRLPVPVVEYIGGDQLEQHQRRDHDQQGAGKQGSR